MLEKKISFPGGGNCPPPLPPPLCTALLIRYFSNSSKLVEHRAQSPVRNVKMLAVWPSIAEGFPNEFARIRKASDESLGQDVTPRHTSHEI